MSVDSNTGKLQPNSIVSSTHIVKKEKSPGPLSYGWFSLGMGKGIKWVLWNSNVTLQRQEKQGDRWLTTEELHLAPKVLKEIVWRLPGWLESIEKNNGGKGGWQKTNTAVVK
jgi:hypothetical protein